MAEHPLGNAAEGAGDPGPTVATNHDDVRFPCLRALDDRGVVDVILDEDLAPISEDAAHPLAYGPSRPRRDLRGVVPELREPHFDEWPRREGMDDGENVARCG